MYSMVMMMAVAGSGDVAACHTPRTHGCSGAVAVSCAPVCAPAPSCGCSGSTRHGLFSRMHGHHSCQGAMAPTCAPSCTPAPTCYAAPTCNAAPACGGYATVAPMGCGAVASSDCGGCGAMMPTTTMMPMMAPMTAPPTAMPPVSKETPKDDKKAMDKK